MAATAQSMLAGRRAPAAASGLCDLHDCAYPVFSIPEAWREMEMVRRTGLERCGGLAWVAACEALSMAGMDREVLSARRVGVCLGTVAGAALDDMAFHREFREGRNPNIRPVLDFLAASPAEALHRKMGLRGPAMTVTTACTSGAQAIIQAADWIRHGVCDIALAGGTEKLSRLTYSGFISLMIADPAPCRPFDRGRQGLNLGEGAGILVLESEDSLRRRGGRRLARVAGSGNGCDAYHLSRPRPDGHGLRRAVEQALREAGVEAGEVAFVNAHGTATPDNDRVEGRLFAERLPGTPFYSSKAYTGHTLGAAGGIEAVLTLDGLLRRRIPATAGFADLDPEIGVAPTREPTAVAGRVAVSTSVAYGGNNTALLLRL